MNKENLKRLITVIEKSESFSMHSIRWGNMFENDEEFGDHPRGTPACIVGHSILLGGDYRYLDKFLGVTKEQRCYMTAPSYDYADYKARTGEKAHITKSHALRMLKKLLETGEVDWKGTKNPPKFDMKTWLSDLQAENIQKEKENA